MKQLKIFQRTNISPMQIRKNTIREVGRPRREVPRTGRTQKGKRKNNPTLFFHSFAKMTIVGQNKSNNVDFRENKSLRTLLPDTQVGKKIKILTFLTKKQLSDAIVYIIEKKSFQNQLKSINLLLSNINQLKTMFFNRKSIKIY